MRSFHLAMDILFWFSLGLVTYTYFTYPVILFAGYSRAQLRSDWKHLFSRRDRRVPALQADAPPYISFLLPAFNEEAHLLEKGVNLRGMDYPGETIQVIFGSDGSAA